MEAAENEATCNFKPAHMVTLSPIPSTPLYTRRLSSRFSKPTTPIRAGIPKKTTSASTMAWFSLQGRLIGAEEASSARTIGGGLSHKEAVAWDLFSPILRVLLVAIAAAVASKCDKNRQIIQLRKCVHLKDEMLMKMQQKLDELSEQMNCIKDQPQPVALRRSSFSSQCDSICINCWLCDQVRANLNDLQGTSLIKAGSGDEMFRNRLSLPNEAEQEERRISDLSDWASSVTSAADIQLNNFSIKQDTLNLKRESEEKDAVIRELSDFIRSKDLATSKRIEELEEVIRRKNTVIIKLKKDLVVLEKQVVSLTRTRRKSSYGASMEIKQIPTLTDNVIYDMDSPTSPLSSDSDSSSMKQHPISSVESEVAVVEAPSNTPIRNNNLLSETVTKKNQKSVPAKHSASSRKLPVQVPISKSVGPPKEESLHQRRHSSASLMLNQVSASLGSKVNRRRTQNGSKDAASAKRWM